MHMLTTLAYHYCASPSSKWQKVSQLAFPVCCTLQLALPWSGFVTLRGEILWQSASCSIKWSWLLQEGSCHIFSCPSSPIRHSLFSAPSHWPSNRISHCCETAFLLLVTAVCTLPSGPLLLAVLTHTRDKSFLRLVTARVWACASWHSEHMEDFLGSWLVWSWAHVLQP